MPLLPPTTPQLINALRLGRPLRESAATFDDGAPEHALSLQQPPPPSPTVAWPRLLSASAEERARRPSRERGLSAPRVLDGPPPTDGGGTVVQTEPDETFLTQSGLIAELKPLHHGWRRLDEKYLKPLFGGRKGDDVESDDEDEDED